jgi:hypothetical protein
MENEKEMVDNSHQEEAELEGSGGSRNMGEITPSDSSEPIDLEEVGKAVDYDTLGKKELVDLVKEALKNTDFKRIDTLLKETKLHFDEFRNKEREEALQKFIQEGGKKDDFEYRPAELDIAFDANYKLLRDKRNQYFREQEENKNANFNRKTELLEKLRALVDAEDSEYSFNAIKEVQREWKHIGPVPNTQAKAQWANYTALVDRFYDNRSIYFELKELDRRKNLELKNELCVKAERLNEVERISDAVKELNELHNEFKHIGPVPKEDKEQVWQRFKAASDAIYKKRDAYLEQVAQELQKNLQEKLKLAEEATAYASFQSDRIKEWNQKTQELLAIQKRWEAAGAIPRAKSKEVNKKFWSAFKAFFNAKSQFFKKLDEERSVNLAKKESLVSEARQLRENTNWQATAQALKDLQLKWKEIGPVPEKARERVYQEFKEACDFFFNQRRSQFDKIEDEQKINLEKKETICSELEQLTTSGSGTREQLTALIEQFNAIGFVPKKAINAIRARFQKAVDGFIASIENVTAEEKENLLLEAEVGTLRNDPDAERKLYQKEQGIRKKITKAENDLAVLRNNLEFFGRSKNAEKYKDEFNIKIKEASDQLAALKNQLKMLKTVS